MCNIYYLIASLFKLKAYHRRVFVVCLQSDPKSYE